jgi:hypothetical protein
VSGRDDCVCNGELEVEEAKEDLARGSGQAQLVCAHVIAFRTLTFSITVLGVETSAARTALLSSYDHPLLQPEKLFLDSMPVSLVQHTRPRASTPSPARLRTALASDTTVGSNKAAHEGLLLLGPNTCRGISRRCFTAARMRFVWMRFRDLTVILGRRE